jgi:CelD/BcsL family acetyltransferase involved in cellulose biosynthesis
VLGIAAMRGDPIAVQLNLRHASCLTALLTFRDDRCADASPGLLLLGRLIDWAADHGIQRFELNATHEWVRRLVDERRTANNVVVFAPTVSGKFFGLVSKAAQSWR